MTTKPLEKTERLAKLFDPYRVMLHNDAHNDMEHVMSALCKSVSQLSQQDAHDIMMEAHRTGVALVISCPLEHAEMYADRLKSFGLTSSIEKGD